MFRQVKWVRVVRADYSEKMQIMYKPGFLEANTFGVELKDGLLVKVNSSSTPDRGGDVEKLGDRGWGSGPDCRPVGRATALYPPSRFTICQICR